jgi:hypothetical protein
MLSTAIQKKYPYFTNTQDEHKLADEWEAHVERVGVVDEGLEWLLFGKSISADKRYSEAR